MKFPDPHLLQVLVAFQEAKNLIEAAEKLKISQPAVTQRLQRLQEQVAVPLYAFEGRKKVLTHYGKGLYDLAKQTFNDLDRGFENLNRRYASPKNLVLRIGGAKELMNLFTGLIEFAGQMDHRKLSEGQALAALQTETIDIAVGSSSVSEGDLVSRRFFEGPSRLLYHRRFWPEVASFRDLQAHPQRLLDIPCCLHRLEPQFIERLCRGLDVDSDRLNSRFVFEDWQSVLGCIEDGGGYSVVPAYIQSRSKSIKEIDIPHATIQRISYYATFHKKLKKIDSFKQVLNFVTRSS